ncbi:MFS transporter [Micromonospora sonneratiae]|uniref:Transcriptional regulator n=1 Tax=Micromonospora sonneratiae TaxID=1184706 RepID=A0ABW3Y9K3_9ACTN
MGGYKNHALAELIAESGRTRAAIARQVVHMGQTEHGVRFCYDYRSIGRWLQGAVPEPPAPDVLAMVFRRLLNRQITVQDLGFDHGDMTQRSLIFPTSPAISVDAATELWRATVERRRFLQGSTFASIFAVEAAIDWRDLPDSAPLTKTGGTLQVTTADVARLHQAYGEFARLDHLHGGGYALNWLQQYLDAEVTPLLRGRYTDPVGRDLFQAAATLTDMAGWMAMDAGSQGLAQRNYTQAAALARHAGDTAYSAYTIGNLATQALLVGQARTAVRLARTARNGGGRAVTATLAARILTTEARAHALGGDKHETYRALRLADQAMAQANPSDDPNWLGTFSPAHYAGSVMHALRDLGDYGAAERHAVAAMNLPSANIRTRALHAVLHASVLTGHGDLDGAVEIAAKARRAAHDLKSQRLNLRLRELHDRLAAHRGQRVVADYLEGSNTL